MKLLKYGLIGIVGLVLLGIIAFFGLGMQSQNGTAPGLVNGVLSACPSSPNCVSSEAGTTDEKRVEPLPLSVWNNLPTIIVELGGSVIQQDETYLAAEFKSSVFGFVDDLEFRKTETDVQVRSGSRVGHSDAGVNAARVAALRDAI